MLNILDPLSPVRQSSECLTVIPHVTNNYQKAKIQTNPLAFTAKASLLVLFEGDLFLSNG